MPFLYTEKEDRKSEGAYAVITGYDGSVRDLSVPEELGGLPVREIGSSAFAGREDIVRVVLPRELRTIRPFAFQRCASLEELYLHNGVADCYDGILRSCGSLRMIHVYCDRKDDFRIIRDILRDADSVLHFHICMEDGEARLTFPEYVNEALEDTMARAIHFSIEGAGVAYRESVGKDRIDFADYDRHLPKLTDYDFEAGVRIAAGRLLYPYKLAEEARERYEQFLKAQSARALMCLIRERETAAVRLMTERKLLDPKALQAGLKQASKDGLTQICSLLIRYSEKETSGQAKGLSLEDW